MQDVEVVVLLLQGLKLWASIGVLYSEFEIGVWKGCRVEGLRVNL